MLKFSNPRTQAEIDNWPNGRRGKVTALFSLEANKKGVRCSRITTGAPKKTNYYQQLVIVDGDDGKTYLIGCTEYAQHVIIPGTLQGVTYCNEREHAEQYAEIGRFLTK